MSTHHNTCSAPVGTTLWLILPEHPTLLQ